MPQFTERLRRAFIALLEAGEAEGFAVDVALEGEDGVWKPREHPYDAVVLDILLPKINGYKGCATLRDEGDWTPILMLSAKTGEWDEAEALDNGADDLLAKPFAYLMLVAHLRAPLRRGAQERPRVLTSGDLVRDPGAHFCRRNGVDLSLSPREFALLEFLMRRADKRFKHRHAVSRAVLELRARTENATPGTSPNASTQSTTSSTAYRGTPSRNANRATQRLRAPHPSNSQHHARRVSRCICSTPVAFLSSSDRARRGPQGRELSSAHIHG